MAETRRVPSASPARRGGHRPHLPHPPRHVTPREIPLDATAELRKTPVRGPEAPAPPPAPPPVQPPKALPPTKPHALPPQGRRAAPRSRTDRAILAVLLLGLALNCFTLAIRRTALSPSDLLLGGVVFLAGAALLVVMEIYRRTGR
jgi:hypothetical protein